MRVSASRPSLVSQSGVDSPSGCGELNGLYTFAIQECSAKSLCTEIPDVWLISEWGNQNPCADAIYDKIPPRQIRENDGKRIGCNLWHMFTLDDLVSKQRLRLPNHK